MKTTVFALLCAATALLCSSCITAAVGAATAATGAAGSALGGGTAMTALGLSSLLGSGAPESMEGRTVTFSGTAGAGKMTFPKGVETNMVYTRTADKTATLTCTDGAEKDVYHLTFTSSDAGSYAVDCTAADGSVRSGHGTFSVK